MPKVAGLDYVDRGDGDASLLIHGSIIARANEPLADALLATGNHRVVTYHRRGLGQSERHTGPFSIADQAIDAVGLLEHLGIRQAHVIGHSYGGLVTVQMALDRPEFVRSLTLIEPPTGIALNPGVREMFSAAVGLHDARFRAGDSAGAVNGFMTGAESPEWKSLLEAVLPGSVEEAERDAPAFFEVENPALMVWSLDASNASRISQPVAFVIGGDARLERQRANRQAFGVLVRQTEEFVVPDASHGMPHQKPRETATTIEAFLALHF